MSASAQHTRLNGSLALSCGRVAVTVVSGYFRIPYGNWSCRSRVLRLSLQCYYLATVAENASRSSCIYIFAIILCSKCLGPSHLASLRQYPLSSLRVRLAIARSWYTPATWYNQYIVYLIRDRFIYSNAVAERRFSGVMGWSDHCPRRPRY